jgi:corrinoid protein of di/trimethylamine methyltransferase
MATSATQEEILQRVREAVIEFDEDSAAEACQAALDAGIDAYEVVTDGLAVAMDRVGQLYDEREYYVPELLLCSDAFYRGLELLKPHIKAGQAQVRGQVVIGTVEGDVHDIGKNLVKLMLEAAGFTVHDLGKDVPIDRFVEEQMRTGADIVALSALMTSTMLAIPIVVQKMRAVNPKVKILIGGAAVMPQSVKIYGADGFGDNATAAVHEAARLMAASQANE